MPGRFGAVGGNGVLVPDKLHFFSGKRFAVAGGQFLLIEGHGDLSIRMSSGQQANAINDGRGRTLAFSTPLGAGDVQFGQGVGLPTDAQVDQVSLAGQSDILDQEP